MLYHAVPVTSFVASKQVSFTCGRIVSYIESQLQYYMLEIAVDQPNQLQPQESVVWIENWSACA